MPCEERYELSIDSLAAVSGGLDCKTAKKVAAINELTSLVLGELGDTRLSDRFMGKADGVLQGAGCHYYG